MQDVDKGRSGNYLEAPDSLDILYVFGEDDMRSYPMGVIAGEEDAAEDQDEEDEI